MQTDHYTKRRRIYERKLKKVLIVGFLLGIVVGLLLGVFIYMAGKTWIGKGNEVKAADSDKKSKGDSIQIQYQGSKEPSGINLSTHSLDKEDWKLVLVNESHPLDAEAVPELAEIEKDRYVDARILDEAAEMLKDAAAAGMSLYICSAYRNYEKQWEVFNSSMADRISQGCEPLAAYEDTKKSVAVPGTSEHATGLAMDITSAQYVVLDEKQAETEEAKWLASNSWKYGFVLRYPPEKSDVTGIIYEPWHYRYVGKEAAKEMTEKNLTLEEYLNM